MKNMEFGLKWVHMARYELILRQDGAIWLRIILKPLLAPKGAIQDPKIPKKVLKSAPNQPRRGKGVLINTHSPAQPATRAAMISLVLWSECLMLEMFGEHALTAPD